MKNTLLVLDLNNLLYKGIHVHQTLRSGPFSTGGLYGFISQMCGQVNQHLPKDIVICGDWAPYLREELIPNYKDKDRRLSSGDILVRKIAHENRLWINKFLNLIKALNWSVKGLEADDCMFLVAKYLGYNYDKVVIVSNDSDLYQLFQLPVNVVLQQGKVLYSKETFERQFPEVEPKDWYKVLAVSGTHNNIPGIPGFGIAKAYKMVVSSKYDQFYTLHEKELSLYQKAIRLPILDIKPPEPTKLQFKEHSVITFLANYRIIYTNPIRKALLYLAE